MSNKNYGDKMSNKPHILNEPND